MKIFYVPMILFISTSVFSEVINVLSIHLRTYDIYFKLLKTQITKIIQLTAYRYVF